MILSRLARCSSSGGASSPLHPGVGGSICFRGGSLLFLPPSYLIPWSGVWGFGECFLPSPFLCAHAHFSPQIHSCPVGSGDGLEGAGGNGGVSAIPALPTLEPYIASTDNHNPKLEGSFARLPSREFPISRFRPVGRFSATHWAQAGALEPALGRSRDW